MKAPLRSLFAAAALAACSATSVFAGQAGTVEFTKLAAPKKGECVEITLGKGMLKFASSMARHHDADAGQVLAGLSSIRVNVVGLDETNRGAVDEQMKTLRERLGRDGWDKIVNVLGKQEEDVAIYVKQVGDDAIDGLVVTVIDQRKKQAVLINITGQIKADQLAAVGEHLHIEHLKRRGKAEKI